MKIKHISALLISILFAHSAFAKSAVELTPTNTLQLVPVSENDNLIEDQSGVVIDTARHGFIFVTPEGTQEPTSFDMTPGSVNIGVLSPGDTIKVSVTSPFGFGGSTPLYDYQGGGTIYLCKDATTEYDIVLSAQDCPNNR